MLYSSAESAPDTAPPPDANSYRPFRVVDHTVVSRITEEFDALHEDEDEGASVARLRALAVLSVAVVPVALVGALAKALCCQCPLLQYNQCYPHG